MVGVLTAVSIFPGEIYKPPMRWTETYFNLKRYRIHNAGGHFAPLEVPDRFVGDLRRFFQAYRG